MNRIETPAGLNRRFALLSGAAAAVTALLPYRAISQTVRHIPQRPSARVIVDNDFAGDPDGLVALIHQLLSPKTRTVLITSSALEPRFTDATLLDRSAAAGADVAVELLQRAAISAAPPVAAGAELPRRAAASPSAAARAIVAEAMRDDPLPLVFTCGGPLTNLADALELEPAIASRMSLIWIGGGNYPEGGWEYNLATDADAARRVIEQSSMPVWQVPIEAYRQMQYPIAGLRANVQPMSPFGAWLYDRFTTPPDFVELGGTWPLGDSPLVLLTALSGESSHYVEQPARRIAADLSYGEVIPNRMVRVYDRLDAWLVFEDFQSLMQLHARGEI